MPAVGLAPGRTVIAENVRDFQSWSSHGRRRYGAAGSLLSRLVRLRRGGAQVLQGAFDLGNHSGRHAGVAGRRLQPFVSEQRLNDANVPAALEQMSREAVAKRMQRERLAQPRGFRGFLEQPAETDAWSEADDYCDLETASFVLARRWRRTRSAAPSTIAATASGPPLAASRAGLYVPSTARCG